MMQNIEANMMTIKVEVTNIDPGIKTIMHRKITMIQGTKVGEKLTNVMVRNLKDIRNHILERARTNMLKSSTIHLLKNIPKINLTLNQERSNIEIRDNRTIILESNHTTETILDIRSIRDIEMTLNSMSLATRKTLDIKISLKTKTYSTRKSLFKVDSPQNRKSPHLRKNKWMFSIMSIDPLV